MQNKILTLPYLETLSSADLISLADDYGIDVPDNLSRRFIIGELLEVAQELEQEKPKTDIKIVENSEENPVDFENSELPKSFNETTISVILRNPVWAFVYWDISEEALKKISESSKFKNLFLRVSYFDNLESAGPSMYFDMDVSIDDREQYVLLESGQKYFRVDLVAAFIDGQTDSLTISERIPVPSSPKILENAFPGTELEIPKILELSGLKKLLKAHYEKYRQSFVK
ncbi:MAG: DUF4912 domain-containing protein [Treponema sp.]|nr:DUF4912 domain-containing protein [Treponema sp.]